MSGEGIAVLRPSSDAEGVPATEGGVSERAHLPSPALGRARPGPRCSKAPSVSGGEGAGLRSRSASRDGRDGRKSRSRGPAAGPAKVSRDGSGESGRSASSNVSMRSARSDATVDLSGEESDVEESGQDALLDGTSPERKRGRGRPPNDPSHAGMFTADKVAEAKEAARGRELDRVAEFVRDPARKPHSPRAAKAERNELRLTESVRNLSTAELASRHSAAVAGVKKVAERSTKIRGALLGELWRSAEALSAVGTALAVRAQDLSETQPETELSRARREEEALLRRNNEQLSSENRFLKARIEALERAGGVPSASPAVARSPSPAKGKKKETRKRVIVESTSSSSNEDTTAPRKKGKGGKGGSPPPARDGSGGAEAMNVSSRPASPTPSQEAGRRAREEVEEDRRQGTMPVATRPAIQGQERPIPESGDPPPSSSRPAQGGRKGRDGAAPKRASRSRKRQSSQTRKGGPRGGQPQKRQEGPPPRQDPGPAAGVAPPA